MNKEHNLLHFRNVDDKFHRLEWLSQHMICKLELIHIFSFHVNDLIYLLLFLTVSVAIYFTVLENNLKCYKWHNHTSFCDYLSLDVVGEVLKNEALCH